MKVVSVVSRKGGSGKSTVATALAGTFATGGVPSAIVDLDPQGSASAWGSSRPADRASVEVVVAKPANLGEVLGGLRARGVAMTIVDTPPHNDAAVAGALAFADVVLMPALPSAFDLHALASQLEGVVQSRKPALAILNSVTPNTVGLREAQAAVAAMGLQLLAVCRRMAWQYAAARGLSPTELEPRGEAANETRAICEAVIKMLDGEGR
ncbi:MAG: AAA family ATPase [Alphaproteobacteria bacterium]|nr:AAA family ATPase [Alphaproteobacteria bacterium]